MISPEDPPGFVVRTELKKAAFDNGFRLERESAGGWLHYASTTAKGEIALAAAGPQGPWFLALDHPGVVAELYCAPADLPGPGLARYAFARLTPLYELLPRVYELSLALPDAPLERFQATIQGLPRSTEAEQLVIQRRGQEIFRASLLRYWQGRCPLTGIADEALLRASHIVPWKDCPDDAERLDVHNGLLLSALWDAAFDRGLVTFDDEGQPLFSRGLSEKARTELRWQRPLTLTEAHRKRLRWHQEHVFAD